MTRYEMTEHYWNSIFEEVDVVDSIEPIKYVEIENGIQWLVHDSNSILDFWLW